MTPERLNVRISKELKRAILKQAKAAGLSESEYIRLALSIQTGLVQSK